MPLQSLAPLADARRAAQSHAHFAIGLCVIGLRLDATWLPSSSPQGDAARDRGAWRTRLTQSAGFKALAEGVLASGTAYEGPFALTDAAGDRQLNISLAPTHDDEGRLTGLMLGVQDLTSHRDEMAELLARAESSKLLADYTFDWEYWIGPEGRLRWMSPSCQRVTGYAVTAFMADPDLLESLVHPEDRRAFTDHLHDDLCTMPKTQMRFRILRPSGEVRWIEHLCQAVFWPNGGYAGRRSVNRDVTETMQVEQALRESENQFRLMFDLATVGMAVVEPATRRLLRVNQRLCRLLGYEPDELLQTNFGELTHPDDREYDFIRYRRAIRQEDTDYFVEKRYLRKDGQVVWALVNATFIRDESGRPLRAVAAIIDITDRREAEARARDLATVVECSSDFIGIAGLDRRGIYLNQAGRRLVGLDGGDSIEDVVIEDFFLPEDLAFVRDTILPKVDRTGRWAGELRFRHFRTQEPIAVFYDALRIDDPETGRPLQYATVTRDIRKEKAAEEALLDADRRKDEFLAMLGHELRNPMAPIRNAVEIIRALTKDQDARLIWAVDVLNRQTAHMGRLLDDLLDVSRIVRDRIDLSIKVVELRDVVQQAVDGVLAMMQERHHRLHCELPPAELRVEGDPVRLSQILLNILVNAARYTPEHGQIRVDWERRDGEVVLSVRDNGQGMSEAQIESMFAMFAQGVNPAETPAGGLGLGLTIARRLAELHHGKLEATSAGPGQGTELRLHLPLLSEAEDARTLEPQAGATEYAGCEALRILIVDDNPDVAGALAMLLEIHGYHVQTADSGPAALTCASAFRPRVAFLDIGIPGMDGWELARRLRADHPDREQLMLVALTGLGHEKARERSLAAGFDEHLVKPLEQDRLLSLLDGLC